MARRAGARKWRLEVLCAAVACCLVASSCTSGSPRTAPTTTSVTLGPVITQGGALTVAAEGEPGCMDWISTCAGSTWGVWTVETNTMPRAYDYSANGQYEPSILLTGEATVKMSPLQVVTYHLNPRAVWSDGQPITSQDFQYTWDQIAHGPGIADTAGYSDIASVDDSDPLTAVVSFSQPYADWRSLFGGFSGLLPSHLLEGQDRDALMASGYSWSGGPWELAPNGWVRGQSITLVPNPDYWGKKPDLASVTFRIFTSQTAELAAYQNGEVAAVYPAPEAAAAGYRNLPGTSFSVTPGLDFDALWFNTAAAPVDDRAVRQAIAYALDRSALATELLGALAPAASDATTSTAPTAAADSDATTTTVASPVQPLESLLPSATGDYVSDDFAKYSPDQAMVTQLMRGAGWSRGTDGIWTKGSQQAVVDLKTPAGSPSLPAAAQTMAAELQAAGFVVHVDAPEATQALVGDLTAGTFTLALYSVDLRRQLPSGTAATSGVPEIMDSDPGQCQLFCSSAVPVAATGGATVSGSPGPADYDYVRLDDTTLDRYLSDLDASGSTATRQSDATQSAAILASDVPALPLVTLPDVFVVNSAKVAVEGGVFNHNLAYGPFGYLNEWYLK